MLHNFNLLALSSLLTASFAAPTPAPQAGTGVNDPSYSWSVTGWSAGCARSGCYYGQFPLTLLQNPSFCHLKYPRPISNSISDFNVTAPAYNDIPAFSAYCSGGPEGAVFRPCNVFDDLPGNRGVAAHLLEAETGTGAHIEVSLQWTDLEQT